MNATQNGTVYTKASGRIAIRLGTGNGEYTCPAGVTFEQAREIACELCPVGTPSRKHLIKAACEEITE